MAFLAFAKVAKIDGVSFDMMLDARYYYTVVVAVEGGSPLDLLGKVEKVEGDNFLDPLGKAERVEEDKTVEVKRSQVM